MGLGRVCSSKNVPTVPCRGFWVGRALCHAPGRVPGVHTAAQGEKTEHKPIWLSQDERERNIPSRKGQSNGNLPWFYRFSLEMGLFVSQSTQPCGLELKGSWGVFLAAPKPGNPLTKLTGAAGSHGVAGGPHGTGARGSCRIRRGCLSEVQVRASILSPKLMGSHQETNPRINENGTKLVNKERKRGKKKKLGLRRLQENSFQRSRCSALRFFGG